MEQTVDLRQVTEAIRQLRDRSERISRRNVQAIVGGSMTTVHRLLDEALSAERAMSTVQTSTLSESLVRAILGDIGGQVQAATEALDLRIRDLTAREQEILSDLEGSEGRVAALLEELGTTKTQLSEERQFAEKASAVSAEQQASLREQLDKLVSENNTLVRTGEAARTETAKAQLQVERADIAAAKAESRVQELETRIAELTDAVRDAQKRAAVAERHAQDLGERISELATQAVAQTEVLQKSASTVEQIRQEVSVAHKTAADADKRAALAEQQAESRVRELESRVADLTASKEVAEKGAAAAEQLRQELGDARKSAAESDKKAALAEQRLSLLEKKAEKAKV
jgi:colicin import membrane protein